MTNSEQKRSGLMSPSNDIFSLKRLWFVLLLIFDMANAFNFVLSSDGQVMTSPDCDFTGNDIGSAIVSTTNTNNVAQCGVRCAKNPNCNYFTYNPTTLMCWLKKPFPAGSVPAVSAGPSCGYVVKRPSTLDTCSCDYSSPGCRVTKAASPGEACNCVIQFVPSSSQYSPPSLICKGNVIACLDPSSFSCRYPGTDQLSCLQGQGNCLGYPPTPPPTTTTTTTTSTTTITPPVGGTCDCDIQFEFPELYRAYIIRAVFGASLASGCKVSHLAPSGLVNILKIILVLLLNKYLIRFCKKSCYIISGL